jgi:hypothetical protein
MEIALGMEAVGIGHCYWLYPCYCNKQEPLNSWLSGSMERPGLQSILAVAAAAPALAPEGAKPLPADLASLRDVKSAVRARYSISSFLWLRLSLFRGS